MTKNEYNEACANRSRIISLNRSNRMMGKPSLPVPAKPALPMAKLAYDADGNYMGRILEGHDTPAGCTIKLEPAIS